MTPYITIEIESYEPVVRLDEREYGCTNTNTRRLASLKRNDRRHVMRCFMAACRYASRELAELAGVKPYMFDAWIAPNRMERSVTYEAKNLYGRLRIAVELKENQSPQK